MCGKIITVLLIFVVLNCSMARYNGRLHCIVGSYPPATSAKQPPISTPRVARGRYIWLKFVWSISRTLMLIGIKMFTELGHRDHYKSFVNPSKINVNPGNQVHSNDLFSGTTAPMILKFHMQHDKAAGL